MALSLNIPFMKKAAHFLPRTFSPSEKGAPSTDPSTRASGPSVGSPTNRSNGSKWAGEKPAIVSTSAAQQEAPEPGRNEQELLLSLYRIIIDRYRGTIEEFEAKSISDLKGRVRPHDENIIEMRESITQGFHPFVYEEHFLQAAKMCFSYVSSFAAVSPPVSFWLEFSDMQKLMAGDEIDKSVLFCSLVRSLGCEDAKVFVIDSKRSCVVFGFGGKYHVADQSQKEMAEAQSKEAALALLKGKALYCFNDKEHEDFQEPD